MKLKNLTSFTPELAQLVKELKDLRCNDKNNLVCCETGKIKGEFDDDVKEEKLLVNKLAKFRRHESSTFCKNTLKINTLLENTLLKEKNTLGKYTFGKYNFDKYTLRFTIYVVRFTH